MSEFQIQIHASDKYSPTRVYFCVNPGEQNTALFLRVADDQLVSTLRDAADSLEAQLAKDRKKAEITARIQAEMDAEAVA